MPIDDEDDEKETLFGMKALLMLDDLEKQWHT
jgi:hypothetical protein